MKRTRNKKGNTVKQLLEKDMKIKVKRLNNVVINIQSARHARRNIRQIFKSVSQKMNQSSGNQYHGLADDAAYHVIKHRKPAFAFNPNQQLHSFSTYVYIPHSKDVTVVKKYECDESVVSEYNVLREITMQIYAGTLAEEAGVQVPKIIKYAKMKLPSDKMAYFIEMEYIDYKTLAEYVREHTPDERTQTVLYDKIMHGISVFEQHLLFHNDLNVENILVHGSMHDPDVCVIDYGLASTYYNTEKDFQTMIRFFLKRGSSRPPNVLNKSYETLEKMSSRKQTNMFSRKQANQSFNTLNSNMFSRKQANQSFNSNMFSRKLTNQSFNTLNSNMFSRKLTNQSFNSNVFSRKRVRVR
jgi:tRNA A-37 threonylcarbamoyl transferase component Bud32